MERKPESEKEFSLRIHMDWWGKCRTCRFWNGANGGHFNDPRWEPAICENPASLHHGKETWTEGHCPKWDSYDIETAFELMEEWENDPRFKKT
jgi:hypothetical protein